MTRRTKKTACEKEEVFALWGRVLKGDKQAKRELRELWLKEFPGRGGG